MLGMMLCSVSASGAEADAGGDLIIGPSYTNAPELTVREDVPHGSLHMLTMNSVDSQI